MSKSRFKWVSGIGKCYVIPSRAMRCVKQRRVDAARVLWRFPKWVAMSHAQLSKILQEMPGICITVEQTQAVRDRVSTLVDEMTTRLATPFKPDLCQRILSVIDGHRDESVVSGPS